MIVVDDFTLLRIARALNACEKAEEDQAEAIYERMVGVKKSEKFAIPSLEKYRDLRNRLIEFLEEKQRESLPNLHKKSKSKAVSEVSDHKALLWERFTILRKLAASDCPALAAVKLG